MITKIQFPDGYEYHRAAFYLAAEEYVATRYEAGSYLFTWQLRPTVVMGRNQVAHQEVDIDFCRHHHIDIIRRKSGGGAIFADEGNIMVSLITEGGAVEPIFERYAHSVAAVLRELGAPAIVSGRNDILLEEGGKVCGNAFYHLRNRNIVHGTMLYDTASHLMEGALHPDVSKLEAKGVKSVRRRVSLLKDYLPFGISELRRRVEDGLSTSSLMLTAADIEAIEAIEATYYDEQYLYGSSAKSDVTLGGRIEGCGELLLHFSLRGSIIHEVTLSGDFFELSDAHQAFSSCFCGATFTPAAMTEAIRQSHPESSIRGLSEQTLADMLA